MALSQADRRPNGNGRHTLSMLVLARPENVCRTRAALDELGLEDELAEVAKLLLTELVTNSIRHAGLVPTDEIRVSILWTGATLRVSVDDRRLGTAPPVLAGGIRPSPGANSGWGLYLVDRLATRWGVDEARGYWFELEATPDGSQATD